MFEGNQWTATDYVRCLPHLSKSDEVKPIKTKEMLERYDKDHWKVRVCVCGGGVECTRDGNCLQFFQCFVVHCSAAIDDITSTQREA